MNMREAFEKWARSEDLAIQHSSTNAKQYSSSMTQFAWMGYAAAIEAVKAGGATAYQSHSGTLAYDVKAFPPSQRTQPIVPLYKLPEELK